MIIYGKNSVYETLLTGHSIKEVYVDNKFNDKKILNLLAFNNIPYESVSKDVLNKLTKNAVHQGIVCNIKDFEYYDLEEFLDPSKDLKFIILDEITDPQNFGSIIRSAESTNMTAIIISKNNCCPITSAVVKASVGALEHVKIIMVVNINKCIQTLKDNNIVVVGTSMDAKDDYTVVKRENRVAVILGSEGSGIRFLVKKNCDYLVSIPMYGKINSLNVSVAAALLMYQMVK